MFSQATVNGLTVERSGQELLISWESTSPAGTTFQLYLSRVLTWWGTETSVLIPWPAGEVDLDVGTVDDGEGPIDFSETIPPQTQEYCNLEWTAGSFLAAGSAIAGFEVFGSPTAGASVSYTAPIAVIPFDPTGTLTSYSWTSQALTTGVWTFGVCAVDQAGNLSTPATASVTVAAPPAPPAANAQGVRLTYTFNPATSVATLFWLASPG
jgi:hypothetical protein